MVVIIFPLANLFHLELYSYVSLSGQIQLFNLFPSKIIPGLCDALLNTLRNVPLPKLISHVAVHMSAVH